MAHDFEIVATNRWTAALAASTAREAFLISFQLGLKPFLDHEALSRLQAAVLIEEEPRAKDVRVLQSTCVGNTLFQAEAQPVLLSEFEAKAQRALDDCEHNNITRQDIAGFYAAIDREVKAMKEMGMSCFCLARTLKQSLG